MTKGYLNVTTPAQIKSRDIVTFDATFRKKWVNNAKMATFHIFEVFQRLGKTSKRKTLPFLHQRIAKESRYHFLIHTSCLIKAVTLFYNCMNATFAIVSQSCTFVRKKSWTNFMISPSHLTISPSWLICSRHYCMMSITKQ